MRGDGGETVHSAHIRDAIFGVGNDEDLMAFNTWREEQPDENELGLVLVANDHASKSCSVWWAGPETEFLRQMQAEAQARGINLVVHQATYSKSEYERAVELILGGERRLEEAGFDLQLVSGPTPDFQGLTVGGLPIGGGQPDHLGPELVARVRDVLAFLLRDAVVQPSDIKVECRRVHPF